VTIEIPIIETKFVPPVVKDTYIRRPTMEWECCQELFSNLVNLFSIL
jgi:hypothetical protein